MEAQMHQKDKTGASMLSRLLSTIVSFLVSAPCAPWKNLMIQTLEQTVQQNKNPRMLPRHVWPTGTKRSRPVHIKNS